MLYRKYSDEEDFKWEYFLISDETKRENGRGAFFTIRIYESKVG